MKKANEKAKSIAKKLEPEIRNFEKFIEKHPEVIEKLKKILSY